MKLIKSGIKFYEERILSESDIGTTQVQIMELPYPFCEITLMNYNPIFEIQENYSYRIDKSYFIIFHLIDNSILDRQLDIIKNEYLQKIGINRNHIQLISDIEFRRSIIPIDEYLSENLKERMLSYEDFMKWVMPIWEINKKRFDMENLTRNSKLIENFDNASKDLNINNLFEGL